MTHKALGTVCTFILLNCIKQGNFKPRVLILMSCGVEYYRCVLISICQTASLQSYDFICLYPSGQYAISTSKCK